MLRSLYVLIICLAFVSFAGAVEYTEESFDSLTVDVFDDDELVNICREFYENTDEIDLARKVQSMWESIDPDNVKEYFAGLAKSNPDSPKILYLYGRVLKNPVEQIRTGRRVIELNPKWSYGYRLTLATYVKHLFMGRGEDVDTAAIAAELPTDGHLFAEWTAVDPDDLGAEQFLCYYQIYMGQYDDALAGLQKAQGFAMRWANNGTFADLYARMGCFDEALDHITADAENLVGSGSLPDAGKQPYIRRAYIRALRNAGKYGAAIAYVADLSGRDASSSIEYDLACLHALNSDNESAMKCLQKSAELGWDNSRLLAKDEDLVSLASDSRWDGLVKTVAANREAGKDARKAEALAEKIEQDTPDGIMVDMNGNEVSFADLRGSVVVIDFWAIWCGPCRLAMPLIDEFVKNHKKDGVRVISLNVWEKGRKKAREFMDDNGYEMELLFGSNDVTQAFGVRGIPTMVVIDKNGKIRYQESGYHEGLVDNLIWWTDDLLATP
jgi:thiol-disulfide isomerase/thioredoxin